MDRVFQYVDAHFDRFVEDLKALCRQPSIAAQNLGMAETAELVAAALGRLGAEVQILPTGGQPVVFGLCRGESERTLLFYNHYDVQPPEPLDRWVSPPFEPQVREGKLFARGVGDNKGAFMSRVQAVEALLQTRGKLPCTVKFLVEGEEEIGSPYLAAFAAAHQELWKADACLWEGATLEESGRPSARLGCKGVLCVELRVRGAATDFHSRQAPILPHPAWDLVHALATLRAPDGRVLIDGFYDGIEPISEAEEGALAAMPVDEAKLLARAGLPRFPGGLSGREAIRKLYTEPAATLCGLTSGYSGPGHKMVLPCEASAKIEFPLVAGQDPHRIHERLVEHLRRHGFGHVEVELTLAAHGHKTPVDSPLVQLLAETAELVYGRPLVVEPMAAGTSPMNVLARLRSMPIAGIGVAWQGSNNHAPNENIRLEDYRRATKHVAAVIDRFATPNP